MVKMRSSPASNVAWSVYAAALALLATLGLAFLHQQSAEDEYFAHGAAGQQLQLLRSAIQGALERNQYRDVIDLVSDWGASSPQLVDLGLTARNGETIAEYHRATRARESLPAEATISYSFGGEARLRIDYDLDPLRAGQRRFTAELLAFYVFLAATSGALVHLVLRRQQALARLNETAIELDHYFDNALDLFVIGHSDNRARKLNRRWTEVLGHDMETLTSRDLLSFVHPDDVESAAQALSALARQERVQNLLLRVRHADGSYRYLEMSASPHGDSFISASRDVSDRVAKENEIRFLNRIYSTLSETNQLIVRCRSESALFEGICRIAVEQGQVKLAWIGREEAGTARIRPVASYGERRDLLARLELSTRADLPAGRGPVGHAFRDGEPHFVNDFANDPRLEYWRRQLSDWHWGSFACIPVRRHGHPYAVLAIYDAVPHAFTGKILDLLREMAHDIEYALARIDLEDQKQRADEELRIAAIAFESQEALIVTDTEGSILRVNAAFTQTTGYAPEEVIGKNPRVLQSGRHSAEFFEEMWAQILSSGHWQGEVWDKRKNGEIYPKWLSISSVRNREGAVSHYVGSFSDISERKEAAAAISRLAYYDALTALPNRQLMMDRLKQALRTSARGGRYGAILFLDLDNFKTINDTLGHDEGDKLLQEAARRLRASVRDEDTVARFGGDEFVVLLEDLDGPRERAAVLAKGIGDKLLTALARPYRLRDKEHLCSASIGVTLWRGGPMTDEHELLKRSDLAMYEAKKAGRNAVRFFDPIMQTTIENRTRMEARLRMGLQLKQFQLHFQRQVAGAGTVLGAEALLRWHDPERGVVSPAEFIPMAEESDLIASIGHWVLETACRQLREWSRSEATRELHLSVNISPKQFGAEWFVPEVAAILSESGANPALLQLEITEGMLLTNVEETIAKMSELRAIGVTFALDDFGIGYSSLSYLQRLPLNVLKIDQSFVQDLGTNQRSEAIVKTVIQMGQSLGLDVLAEGVETDAQRRMLIQLGCVRFQGYLFGRPIPIEAFAKALSTPLVA